MPNPLGPITRLTAEWCVLYHPMTAGGGCDLAPDLTSLALVPQTHD